MRCVIAADAGLVVVVQASTHAPCVANAIARILVTKFAATIDFFPRAPT
jgi:hypothetical protein